MRKLWDKFVALVELIPLDKWLHYIAGLFVAATSILVFKMTLCILPAIVAGVAKEVFDKVTTKQWDWFDFLATTLGGATIQVLTAIGMNI